MIIKKLEQNEVYKRVTLEHTLEVNGKKIRVLEYKSSDVDDLAEPYVDEEDIAKLTEPEQEMLNECLNEWIDLTVGCEIELGED